MSVGIAIRGIEVGRNVANAIRNSRLFNNQRSTTVTRGDKTASIEIASDISDIATTIGGASSNVLNRTLNGGGLTIPNPTSGAGLVQAIRDGANLSKTIAEGLKSQTLAVESIAEIFASMLANKVDLLSSINLTLVAIGHELKAMREMREEENISNLPLKHISLEKVLFQMYGVTPDGEPLTDTEGNQIIPEYAKAKANAENFIGNRDENEMDYSGAEELFNDDKSDFNILSKILENAFSGIDTTKIDKV
jgi:hypothetical protein